MEFVDGRLITQAARALTQSARAALVQPGGDVAASRAYDQEAVALLQALAGDEDNVVRRWLLAQALTEEARALSAQGARGPALARAESAAAAWSEGSHTPWPPALQQRVEALHLLLTVLK